MKIFLIRYFYFIYDADILVIFIDLDSILCEFFIT